MVKVSFCSYLPTHCQDLKFLPEHFEKYWIRWYLRIFQPQYLLIIRTTRLLEKELKHNKQKYHEVVNKEAWLFKILSWMCEKLTEHCLMSECLNLGLGNNIPGFALFNSRCLNLGVIDILDFLVEGCPMHG